MRRVDALIQALRAVLEQWPAVRAAWLFGSRVAGTAGPLSDVDVGVLGLASATLDDLALLSTELGRAAGVKTDVVVVERASPVLAMQISGGGVRFYAPDDGAADDWEERALRRYLGTAELRKIVSSYVSADLSERR